jgi:nucleoside-diphosphate-sugar epimerase
MLYTNKLWINDIDNVINNFPEFKLLNNKSILITGATGLICSAIIELLIRYNEKYHTNIKVFAACRNYDKYKLRFKSLLNRNDLNFIEYDATKTNNINSNVDYIIHGASNASPKAISNEPVETILSNILGLKNLLDYSKQNNVKRLLYISSSEIYGKNNTEKPLLENNYGFIDVLNVRNSYSVGKKAAETLCASYNKEYNTDSVIVRPGHIYGPTATKNDNRISSEWVYLVANNENIVMKSEGKQIRSYCHCLDCATAILKVLLEGKSGEAYNISNEKSIIDIKTMANILVNYSKVELKLDLPTNTELNAFNPMLNSSLNNSKLKDLGWNGFFDAKNGFEHTVEIIKSQIGK